MKTASFIGVLVLFFLFFLPHKAISEVRNDVNIKTNTGNNTVCVNGKCTTTNGSSNKSKACVNGKCFESDGDLQYESEDGKTKINIKSNSSVSVSQQSEASVDSTVEVNNESLGISTEAAEEAESEERKKEEEAAQVQEEVEDKKNEVIQFIEETLAYFRSLITFQFLFGSK